MFREKDAAYHLLAVMVAGLILAAAGGYWWLATRSMQPTTGSGG